MLRFILAVAILARSVFGQLTIDQKVLDFQSIASLYAKRYGPANWKIQALGVNPLDTRVWLDRVRQTRTDIEFYEVLMQYTATFQDGHTRYILPSTFSADLGLFTDLYDGKLLIELIDRGRYPLAQFPFEIGDKLVSIDGRAVEEIIQDNLRFRRYGTMRGSLRAAADAVVFRPQSIYPRAVETPDTSQVVIRRASGAQETYQLTWVKTGQPLTSVSPVPLPIFSRKPLNTGDGEDALALLQELQNWRVDQYELATRERTIQDENGQEVSRLYILGWGGRGPYYSLPGNFVLRRGLGMFDNFYTGTYEAGGRRIGYLRIPHFSPSNLGNALGEFSQEIQFFRANTDGLVVDVSRNTGGGCVGISYLSLLMPSRFTTFQEQLRPTQSLINSAETSLRLARLQNRPEWVIQTYEFLYNSLVDAAKGNRAMTGPISNCPAPTTLAPSDYFEPPRDPNGELLSYTKPIILLADELSVSFGDIFPAMFQDNKRGPVVGMRTGGWGGSISGFPGGYFSEGTATNTNSLVVRWQTASAPGLPPGPYIENIGVQPDIELDYMTRENLMQRGKPFVDRSTEIILAEIAKASPTP